MIDISEDDLIRREVEFRKEHEGLLRASIIDSYMLEYQPDRQEIIPVRHYDACVMTKTEVETVIKGLTNYVNNKFTNEDIDKYNNERKEERDRLMYGENFFKEKTKRERLLSSKVQEGVVYFIKEEFSGTFKIGKTKNLKRRTSQFGVKLPFDWSVVKTIDSKDYNLTEMLLHQKYESKRVNGEWFSLSEEDLEKIMNEEFEDEILDSIKGVGDLYGK